MAGARMPRVSRAYSATSPRSRRSVVALASGVGIGFVSLFVFFFSPRTSRMYASQRRLSGERMAAPVGVSEAAWFSSLEAAAQPQTSARAGEVKEHVSDVLDRHNGACSVEFTEYVPAGWETQWLENVGVWQHSMCDPMMAQLRRYRQLMALVAKDMSLPRQADNLRLPVLPADDAALTALREELMSQVRFSVTCFPQKGGAPVVTKAREWIEPLVAFLRHPLTMCAAMYPESVSEALSFGTRLWRLPRDAVETVQNMIEVRSVCGGGNQQPHCLIQNKDFLLLRGASIANTVMTAGTAGQKLADGVPVPQLGHRTRRSILFDLGCSMFHVDSDHDEDMTKEWVSLDWLLTRYKSRGVTFTNVLAFEFMAVNHQDWWDGVPADMFSTITFYNVGVSAEPDSKYNPWNLLRALAEPDDFVVIKLDIDTPTIENTLIDQLLADKQLQGLVDEMFYEHHVLYDGPDRPWPPTPGFPTAKQSYDNFSALRRGGLRMHSWP